MGVLSRNVVLVISVSLVPISSGPQYTWYPTTPDPSSSGVGHQKCAVRVCVCGTPLARPLTFTISGAWGGVPSVR